MYAGRIMRLLIAAALCSACGRNSLAHAQARAPATGQQRPQPGELSEAAIATSPTSPAPLHSTGVSASPGRPTRSGRTGGAGGVYGYATGQSGLFLAPGGNRVLLVPSGQLQQGRMESLNEDLTIMCRLFDRLFAEAGLDRQERFTYGLLMGADDDWLGGFFDDAGPMGCLYVEGYGPLFLLNVDFPLLGPLQRRSETDANEPADPLWEQVRQETYAPQAMRGRSEAGARSQYSAEKVRLLKETLVRALRHAANIRGLDEDAWLTVTVRGPAMVARGMTARIGSGLQPEDLYAEMMAPVKPVATATLTIRASIRDVNALAAGQLDGDEFAERVEITEP